MINQPLVSICIPTCKREYLIKKLLDSIYSKEVDENLFEVCITDNSDTDETKELIKASYSNIKNLNYKKNNSKGFYNSIEALKLGSGKLLKLHNDYSIFKDEGLKELIENVKKHEEEKPLLYFGLGQKRLNKFPDLYETFSLFYKSLGILATWSSGFSIWKTDFDKLMDDDISINHMYPHTSLLFKMTYKNKFVINNTVYTNNVEPKKKGGYNLVDNFIRIYLGMVKEDLLYSGIIDEKLYKKIEKEAIAFCAMWYWTTKRYPDKYTFLFDDSERIIEDVCGDRGVRWYSLYKNYYCLKNTLKKLIYNG